MDIGVRAAQLISEVTPHLFLTAAQVTLQVKTINSNNSNSDFKDFIKKFKRVFDVFLHFLPFEYNF
jgi:hypothetical protein